MQCNQRLEQMKNPLQNSRIRSKFRLSTLPATTAPTAFLFRARSKFGVPLLKASTKSSREAMEEFECGICSSALRMTPQDKEEVIRAIIAHSKKGAQKLGNTGTIWKSACKSIQDTQNVVATDCGHLYHRQCLLKWLRIRYQKRRPPACPFCNHEFQYQTDVLDLDVKFDDADGSEPQVGVQLSTVQRIVFELDHKGHKPPKRWCEMSPFERFASRTQDWILYVFFFVAFTGFFILCSSELAK